MKLLVIGGTGTIGSSVVKELSSRHEVLIAGASKSPLKCDIGAEDSIRALFEKIGKVDGVIITVGKVHFEELTTMDGAKYLLGLNHKLMGQVRVVMLGTPFLKDGGSFTLTSGILNHDPIRTGTSAAMVNGAIEGFVTSAAMELPRGIRINVVSPTILVEAPPEYASIFRGFKPVPAADVALAYSKSVEGIQTGKIYKVGY